MSTLTMKDRLVAASLLAALVAVGAMWLPWFRSGQAPKNSFDAFRAAQLFGIEWLAPFRVVWFLVPVLVVAAGALLLYRRRRSAAAGLLVAGLALTGVGVVALVSIGTEPGSTAATLAGVCTIVLSAGGIRG